MSLFGNTNPQAGAAPSGGLFGNTATQQPAGGTGGSLFGNANQQQPAAGGSLFGSTAGGASTGGSLFGNANANTNTNSQGGGSLFGNANANTNTQPNTSLFGNPNPNANNQPAPSLFGNTSTQQQPAGGGLFGNTATQPAAGGSLFGNQSATNATLPPGSLFGNAGSNTTNTSLFGNANATGTNTNTTGGGLFSNAASGSTNTTGGSFFGNTAGAGNTGGGGLFGNAAGGTTNSGGGNLFGNTAGNVNTAGGSLFGNTNVGGGGLFGNTSTPNPSANTTGSLFGSSMTAPSTAPTGGLFGTQSQAGPSANPASLFGTSTLLGQPPQQQRPGSLFGNSTLGASTLLGSTANNLFSSRISAPATQQQVDAQTQYATLTQRIESIAQAWSSNSSNCRFQHYFYNLVDPSQVYLYGRPPNATNDALWQKAIRENPDPSCLVPVIAIGFDDLQQRVHAQSQQAAAHQDKLKELQTRITALSQRHQLSNAARLQRASVVQTQLTHRVLKVVQHLHLLIPAVRSSAIRPEEEALRAALEDIDQEIRRPGGTGRMRGKLNELWALVGAVTAARERDRKPGGVEWAVVDEEGLNQLAQILAEEQAGLTHLTKILQKDLKDLAVIQGTNTKEEDPDIRMGSTSTLRGSTAY